MTTMSNKYEILGKYIKDLSSETPDLETYLFVKDRIEKYQLDGTSKREYLNSRKDYLWGN